MNHIQNLIAVGDVVRESTSGTCWLMKTAASGDWLGGAVEELASESWRARRLPWASAVGVRRGMDRIGLGVPPGGRKGGGGGGGDMIAMAELREAAEERLG